MRSTRREVLRTGSLMATQSVIPRPLGSVILSSGKSVDLKQIVRAIGYFNSSLKLTKDISGVADYELLDLIMDSVTAWEHVKPSGDSTAAFDDLYIPSLEDRRILIEALSKNGSIGTEEAIGQVNEFFLHPDFFGKPINAYLPVIRDKIATKLRDLSPRLETVDWQSCAEVLHRNEVPDLIELPHQLLKSWRDCLSPKTVTNVEGMYARVSYLEDTDAVLQHLKERKEGEKKSAEKHHDRDSANFSWFIEPSLSTPTSGGLHYDVFSNIASPVRAREFLNALRARLEEFYDGHMHASDFTMAADGKLRFQVKIDDSLEDEFLDMAADSLERQRTQKSSAVMR